MNHLPYKPHRFISEIAPYKLGKTVNELAVWLDKKPDDIIRLAANENPHGMSPLSRQAILDHWREGGRYPEVYELQKAVAKFNNLDVNMTVPGNGSCEILELAARSFLSPGYSAVMPLYSFAMYKLAARYMGAACLEVPPKTDFTDDLEAMLAAIRPDTRLLYFSNVANPTGTITQYNQIKQFFAAIPKSVVIVFDEAYAEYLDDSEDTLQWLNDFPNLLITRTFSKIYGMAGMRIGYGIAAPPLTDIINRMRGPYNCNSLGILAAQAALQDENWIKLSRQRNKDGLQQLSVGLTKRGYSFIPPSGNFVTVNVGDAKAIAANLLKTGIVTLPLNCYGLPQYLRVSVGTTHEQTQLLAQLDKI